jgi:hypothetical protein
MNDDDFMTIVGSGKSVSKTMKKITFIDEYNNIIKIEKKGQEKDSLDDLNFDFTKVRDSKKIRKDKIKIANEEYENSIQNETFQDFLKYKKMDMLIGKIFGVLPPSVMNLEENNELFILSSFEDFPPYENNMFLNEFVEECKTFLKFNGYDLKIFSSEEEYICSIIKEQMYFKSKYIELAILKAASYLEENGKLNYKTKYEIDKILKEERVTKYVNKKNDINDYLDIMF